MSGGTLRNGAVNEPQIALAEPEEFAEDEPTSVPRMAWVSLVGFAIFVIAFGTCASNWMFN